MNRKVALAAMLVIACGGKRAPAPPKKPGPIDPAKLAAQLHGDLVKLGEIARRLKADCPALVAELRVHVRVMLAHKDDVERARADAEIGVKLKAEVEAYAESSRGLGTAIGVDLAAAWHACSAAEELRAVIDLIPEL